VRLFDFIGRSVRSKTMAVVLATAFAALLVNALALLAYEFLTYRAVKLDEARAQAEILGRAAAPAIAFNDPKDADASLATLKARADFVAAALYVADGRRFAASARDAESQELLPARMESEMRAPGADLLHVSYEIVERGQRIGWVYLVTQLGLRARIGAYVAILVAVMALALGAAAALSARLQRAVTGPILAIDAAARRVVERADFSVRAARTTDDEIGVLAEAFNRMLDEVQVRQEQLRLADRRKDEFLATLAHELRNPLAPIRNALYMMKIAPGDAEGLANARLMIERQVRQMVHLVDDLLDVSRITTGKLILKRERVELQSVARNALEGVQPIVQERGIDLSVALPKGAVSLYADPTRLTQVFLNLLNNAVKFSEPRGKVWFRCAVEEGELVAAVRDEGIGIAPAQLESIFGMFAQADQSLERRSSGLGVGLALARRIVELHGGTISARSEGLGRGAEFVVRIPLPPGAVAEPGVIAPVSRPRGETRQRILVVDDNKDFALSLASMLRAMRNEVRVEYDGAAGLSAALEFRPDVAFLDIGMPGLNGFELARRLRAAPQTSAALLVAVTGYGQPADHLRGRESGFDHYLIKPIEAERLQEILGGQHA
jgi:two-component system, sensor histidine kinase